MDRPGSRRRLGVALLMTAGVLLVIGALCLGGLLRFGEESRLLVGAALMAAAVVDAGVGVMFLRQA
jgi:hypothetical protein